MDAVRYVAGAGSALVVWRHACNAAAASSGVVACDAIHAHWQRNITRATDTNSLTKHYSNIIPILLRALKCHKPTFLPTGLLDPQVELFIDIEREV